MRLLDFFGPGCGRGASYRAAGAVEVREAVGHLLADGDQVTLIKDLTTRRFVTFYINLH